MHIALVAGELSGDKLGAGLMQALQTHYPQARFSGIGGEQMMAAGLQSRVPLARLSVMGLVEVFKHLPELLAIRNDLLNRWLQQPPDVFIGVDAPDFNLGLARQLRRRGISTVHYVSPQVWAWRRWRVRKIARAIDLMLTLFPFEQAFYRNYHIPVRYVGHPLADEIPLQVDRQAARRALSLDCRGPVLALLPGSRQIEIETLAPVFAESARWLHRRCPDLAVVVAAATPAIRCRLNQLFDRQDFAVALLSGQARNVLAAADVALLTSGTATLEALLVKCPMVVAYKVAPVTAWLARRLVKIPYFALPNLLAGQRLVPEFFQQGAVPEQLGPALLALLQDTGQQAELQIKFTAIHKQLRCNASEQAAAAIHDLLRAR